MSQQKKKYEAQVQGLRVEVQRLIDELSTQKWDQAAVESQLAVLQKQLQESSSYLSGKAKEVDELKRQIARLESQLEMKAKTIVGLEDQLAYQLKAVQDLVKAI